MYNIFEIINNINEYNIIVLSIISILSILSGILIVVTKNPVVSVLYLILLFSNISLYLIFIDVVFIGLSYLLVYVGAVSILFLFILMLINIRVSELISDTNNNIPLAIIVIMSFFIPINNILPNLDKKFYITEFFNVYFVSSNNWDNTLVDTTDITCIGNVMYSVYFIWLIITSIILLLAMVGSIVITIKQKDI